jgi:hypothetical protein
MKKTTVFSYALLGGGVFCFIKGLHSGQPEFTASGVTLITQGLELHKEEVSKTQKR